MTATLGTVHSMKHHAGGRPSARAHRARPTPPPSPRSAEAHCLPGRAAAAVAAALAAGSSVVLAADERGWTLHEVDVDAGSVVVWLPPDVIDVAYTAARAAVLAAVCGACVLSHALVLGELLVTHDPACECATVTRRSAAAS